MESPELLAAVRRTNVLLSRLIERFDLFLTWYPEVDLRSELETMAQREAKEENPSYSTDNT